MPVNTNALKKFAQEARKKLVSQVEAKLEYVLTSDSAELREQANQLSKLQQEISSSSKEEVIDKVAYTWFNRLMALRFMDANDYQPIGIRVITPKEGYTLPELLDEAKQGSIPDELPVKHQRIYDILDGKIPSNNSQNEAYKELLIGACNHLNKVFPFLFEKINDYAELLLPDDLTSEFSIVQDIRNGMTTEDCKEVEVIGWLYQFYISELNDELISSKKKYAKNELAPASQLFTPKWIVEYMVDNTLGQLWTEISPETKITEELDYYIEPAYRDQLEPRAKKSVEEIKFFEPCAGSGHILSYAFDVFYKIYEEEGYNPSEIPELIITKNLFGTDIDQRAAQLASFVLLMKGRGKHRRFLRTVEKKSLQSNIAFYQDFEFDNKFNNAAALGSLIRVNQNDIDEFKIEEGSLFEDRQRDVYKLYQLLGQKYDVVVTNPPYISSSRMEGTLKQYTEQTYLNSKTDLFSCFIERCLELTKEEGFVSLVTPFVWMFLQSYELLRKDIFQKYFLNSLVKPSYTSFFESAIVPLCTFVIEKNVNRESSVFFDFGYLGSGAEQPIRFKKALNDINDINVDGMKSRYVRNQNVFDSIPGSPMGYWLSHRLLSKISESSLLQEYGKATKGLDTCNNERFTREWHEVELSKFTSTNQQNKKWFVYQKGGDFQKWYGNTNKIVNWENDGHEIKNYRNPNGTIKSRPQNISKYFSKGITWSAIGSSESSYRLLENSIFGGGGNGFFPKNEHFNFFLGFLNCSISKLFLSLYNPTLNNLTGDLHRLPIIMDDEKLKSINFLVDQIVEISKLDWNSSNENWEFVRNELIRIGGKDIEEAYQGYKVFWNTKIQFLLQSESELNSLFLDIYMVVDEVKTKEQNSKVSLQKNIAKFEKNNIKFQKSEIFIQLISYSVGCMFGRYSLDKEGLILGNKSETLEDYLKKVQKSEGEVSFLPDDDNIIPILDDEWFEDDIVGRFYEFLKVTFGKENFEKNLAFVEECIGKDIRKFFVKDFYTDHIKRYKKRPIYWMFSSPKGSFNVLVYMHRYTPDTLNEILNGYLKEYREKLNTKMEHLNHLIETGSSKEQTSAAKEKDKLKLVLLELQEYERDVLYPLATERITIDLDDGVLVNYNKFGKAIKEVKGLNDKKTKDKVLKFDWINTEEIR